MRGSEKSFPKIKIWLADPHLISPHKSEDSEYHRKSVRNALRNISKKHPAEVSEELATWNLEDKKTFLPISSPRESK